MFRPLVLLGLLAALPAIVVADEPKDAATKVVHSNIADGKKSCGAACSVNFLKELGVPLDYLGSIGHRISAARKTPDPVELALAAQALAVAEKVSGKQASITAEQVLAEATALVKLRGISSEIAALALIQPEAKQDLEKLAVVAKKREAEAKEKAESGESEKELFGRLTVINHSGECLRIYVSGRYKGEVHAGQTAYFQVHDHNDPTILEAYCEEEGELVSQELVYGHRHSFVWHMH